MQWVAYSPRRRSGDKSGAGVVRGRGSESGGDLEHGKWLLRSSAESGVWRSSDSTAAQSTYAAEQGEGGGARVRGGAGGDGMQGGRVALLIGRRGT